MDKISSRKLSDTEINQNAMKFARGYIAKNAAKRLGIYAGVIGGVKTVSDQMAIKRYLDEHPNSKLSREEILKIV